MKITIPSFLLKLYDILECESYKSIIRWSECGMYFHIVNCHSLCETILPQYFKHGNFSSFVRQLNMYGFHKIKKNDTTDTCFRHRKFIKGKKYLMRHIKRNPNRTVSVKKAKSSKSSIDRRIRILYREVKKCYDKLNEIEEKLDMRIWKSGVDTTTVDDTFFNYISI